MRIAPAAVNAVLDGQPAEPETATRMGFSVGGFGNGLQVGGFLGACSTWRCTSSRADRDYYLHQIGAPTLKPSRT
ncbi:hypothetical protein [Saccharopolyspora hattusasensis]|uniref:hypothetical protein n=1 Tax=Saccharopolyspora hattusasensis TaxID=1128679 RepID=UPI003D97A49D